jgi:hypothetical protein
MKKTMKCGGEIMDFIREMWPILLPIVLIQFFIMLGALISLLRKPVAFEHKIIWLIVILVINTIGPIAYFIIGSKYLDNKIEHQEER